MMTEPRTISESDNIRIRKGKHCPIRNQQCCERECVFWINYGSHLKGEECQIVRFLRAVSVYMEAQP